MVGLCVERIVSATSLRTRCGGLRARCVDNYQVIEITDKRTDTPYRQFSVRSLTRLPTDQESKGRRRREFAAPVTQNRAASAWVPTVALCLGANSSSHSCSHSLEPNGARKCESPPGPHLPGQGAFALGKLACSRSCAATLSLVGVGAVTPHTRRPPTFRAMCSGRSHQPERLARMTVRADVVAPS